jgi:hypothetical protein
VIRAVPDEGQEFERLGEDQEDYIAISAATEEKNREGYNFENQVQYE